MTMTGRRILVDLSAFYVDHRRKSLVYIDRKNISSIQNLVDHISKIFNLRDNFEIFISDAHVPRTESADIIEESDVLRLEKVSSHLDAYEQSTNDNDDILPQDITFKSKKKKRKAPRDEGEKLIEKSSSETPSSNATFTLEPRKKKKKKKYTDEDQDCCGETSHDTVTPESKKNKKSSYSSNEVLQYDSPNKNFPNGDNDIEKPIATETGHQCEPENLLESNQISQSKQAGIEESDSLCYDGLGESFHHTINSRSGEKRRRQRRKRRPKKSKQIMQTSLNEPEASDVVPLCNLPSKKMENMINNCHVRFSDEEENRFPEDAIQGEEQRIVFSNAVSVNPSECEDVKSENPVECPIANIAMWKLYPVESNAGCTEESDVVCENYCNVKPTVLDDNNSTMGELSVPEDRIYETSVVSEPVVKKSEVENGVVEGESVSCSKKVSPEEHPSNSKEWSSLDPRKYNRNRRKNSVIAMGLGATLSQLMKKTNSTKEVVGVPPKVVSCESIQKVKRPKPNKSEETPKQNVKERYLGFPILESLPQKSDILVFKKLKLNERYEPTVSSHLKGKVINCDATSSVVTMEILGGTEELIKTCGKFDLVDEDVINSPTSAEKNDQKILTLHWDEFIEPRLMFP